MKFSITAIVLVLLVSSMGCNQGTSGGPGASSPPSTDVLNQPEDTFSLDMPSAKLIQGETKTVSVGIHRGTNFNQDVSLKLGELPKGVTLEPASALIKHGDTEAKLTVKAAADAALGDFTVKVTGHPTKGADAVSELRISVAKEDANDIAAAAAEVTKAKWAEFTIAMQNQWDDFAAKYEELKARAATAEGQAKADLDLELAEAKTKLDAAAVKLEELRSASADRWEKVKEGVANAFEDLKTIFE